MASGIIEKFEEPIIFPDIIHQQIDETLIKRQTKYPKIVEALDRILYLTGRKEFLNDGHGN